MKLPPRPTTARQREQNRLNWTLLAVVVALPLLILWARTLNQ